VFAEGDVEIDGSGWHRVKSVAQNNVTFQIEITPVLSGRYNGKNHNWRKFMAEKKLSRRDAIKILGAAIGGTALSTLPPQWRSLCLLPANFLNTRGSQIW
jgi:hypothetical protein